MNIFYPSYRRHRFPAEIISHCVWLFQFISVSSGQYPSKCLGFKSRFIAIRLLSILSITDLNEES